MIRMMRCQYDITGMQSEKLSAAAPAPHARSRRPRWRGKTSLLLAALALLSTGNCFAGIIDYRTNTVIPGTENITPGPNMSLNGFNLQYAELSNLDLTGSTFVGADLSFADLSNSSLSGPGLNPALVNVNFSQANLTGANFSFVNSSADTVQTGMNFKNTIDIGTNFTSAELFGANFTGAFVQNSNFANADLTDVQGLVITPAPEPATMWLLPAFVLLVAAKRRVTPVHPR